MTSKYSVRYYPDNDKQTLLIPKDELILLHREQWDWLALNPKMGKRDWPRWIATNRKGGDIPHVRSLCFLCEYGLTNGRHLCNNNCILTWPGGWSCMKRGDGNLGLYLQWGGAHDNMKLKKKLASQIRDLPETVQEGKK